MTTKLLIITVLILAVSGAGAKRTSSPPRNGTTSPPPPKIVAAPSNCSDELVEFSKCLSYIASSPNNATDAPSRHCCNDVASAYNSGSAVCICYLVQKPGLLGFPLNSTRIFALSSLCPIRDHGTKANFSLKSLCSSVHTLPPLSSITVRERPKPRISGPVPTVPQISAPVNPPPPRRVNFTQESTANSGTRGHDDDRSQPAPTFQVFPAWRTFSINESAVNPAGFSLSWWLLTMLWLMLATDCRQLVTPAISLAA